MQRKQRTELEPGFLQAFRLFVVTRMVFWVIIGPVLIVMEMARDETLSLEQATSMTLVERLTLPNLAPVIVLELVLLMMLVLPQAPRRMGKWFVPLTLTLSTVPVLIGYYWWPSANPLQTPFSIFFFVILVLIAWQYAFRFVLTYVLGLTLYQVWLAPPLESVPLSADLGWLILQAAMMLLVGYIIVQLASIQREQRVALEQAYEQQARANLRLKRYAIALEELTISRERNRLARELHDTLAHSLSAVTVQLEAVRSLRGVDPIAAQVMLDRADETARSGLTEARRALQDLRASPLQELGLSLALRDLAKSAAERSGAVLNLELPEQSLDSLTPAVEQGVYRIAQETLENVIRHSEAQSIEFHLQHTPEHLSLTITDDGRGIDNAMLRAGRTGGQDGLGLRGMKERAALMGGKLEIAEQEGQGTRVHLEVPLFST
ncbi:MAG: sensor histidine kinase [Anaerolineae bacterium]|jgi:signal transduction histidine kinase